MIQKLTNAMQSNNQELLQTYSMMIASIIRNEIEDFNTENLSDEKMKELNLLIRNGVYNALFIIANAERDELCNRWVEDIALKMPVYWEAPVLDKNLNKVFAKLSRLIEFNFKSPFLNEQFMLGNLFYNLVLGCLQKVFSSDFKNVEGNACRHGDKITNHLKKEGYKYRYSMDGYVYSELE